MGAQEDHGRFCIAPMMRYTDRHHRFLMSRLLPKATCYTEMIHTHALLHQGANHLDLRDPGHAVVQIGGSDPGACAEVAALLVEQGVQEVNLNVGCPSPKVQHGSFGACLMAEPERVCQCIQALGRFPDRLRVSVKTRIALADVSAEVEPLMALGVASGCHHWIIHARSAWLRGLNPKQNRHVPPLDYPRVYALKASYPNVCVILNGGIETEAAVSTHLQHCDGVMLGRLAIHHVPHLMALYKTVFDEPGAWRSALKAYAQYAMTEHEQGLSLQVTLRHLLPMTKGHPGGKRWRQTFGALVSKRMPACDRMREVKAHIQALMEMGP